MYMHVHVYLHYVQYTYLHTHAHTGSAEPPSSEVSSHEDNEEELQTETAEDVTASGQESEEVSGTAI